MKGLNIFGILVDETLIFVEFDGVFVGIILLDVGLEFLIPEWQAAGCGGGDGRRGENEDDRGQSGQQDKTGTSNPRNHGNHPHKIKSKSKKGEKPRHWG